MRMQCRRWTSRVEARASRKCGQMRYDTLCDAQVQCYCVYKQDSKFPLLHLSSANIASLVHGVLPRQVLGRLVLEPDAARRCERDDRSGCRCGCAESQALTHRLAIPIACNSCKRSLRKGVGGEQDAPDP